MTIWLFVLLLSIGIFLLLDRKSKAAPWYLTITGGLYFLALVSILLVDWAQAGWEEGYLTFGVLEGSWGIWFLESFLFIGLGIWAFKRRRQK